MVTETSIETLNRETDWLNSVINQVIRSYLLQEGHENHWTDIPLPDLEGIDCPYANSVRKWNLDRFGRLALALSLAPHHRPETLDILFGKNQLYDRGFTEFGGLVDKSHNGFLPTCQTLTFLVSATNPEWIGKAVELLEPEHILVREDVLQFGEKDPAMPRSNAMLLMSPSWYHFFLTGEHLPFGNDPSFPATKISTKLDWEDIVLDGVIMDQLHEIIAWLQHGDTLMNEWGLARQIKPGYRALFYGPPGTGKTLTASLLGKTSGKEVYKIDLSMIVSKYIGETEKNLARVFDIAQNKNWILFFDEADALFGKRTAANSSNDRFANQQTAYLLQRVEDYPGVVILASNLNANMDEAFRRRFQSMIHFRMPTAEERFVLWTNAFSGSCRLEADIDLRKVAEDHELAGGAIINVLRYCAIAAIQKKEPLVSRRDLMAGIRKELGKENKTLFVTN